MKNHRNPFVVSLLAQGLAFADREEEVARIEEAFTSPGGELVVYGDRRMGKSSALERAAEKVRNRKGRVAVASFATASDPAEASQRVLSAAQEAIGSSWRDFTEGIARSLRVGFQVSPSLDPTGMPSLKFSFGVDPTNGEGGLLPEVLTALNDQLKRRRSTLGLGLDEFQRIHEWGGENAEWALRDAIQRHHAIAYVLAGSRRTLIDAMVGTKGRALWKLADILPFGGIDPDTMAVWIAERADATGLRIPEEEGNAIVRLAGPRTRDIVQLARAVWTMNRSARRVSPGAAALGMEQVVLEQAELFRTIFVGLNARQQSVLRAFATDSEVRIMSSTAAHWFGLGPKSSVQSSVKSLVALEHLTRQESGRYAFDDPFFLRWVQVNTLADIGEAVPPLEP